MTRRALARGPLSDLAGLHILAPGPVAEVILLVMAIAIIAGTLPGLAGSMAKPHRFPPP